MFAWLCHGFLLQGTLSHVSLATLTTHILAHFRHSPNTTAAMGVISYPLAPRRIWEPTQEGKVTDLRRRRETMLLCSTLFRVPEFKNVLALLGELRGDYDWRVEVQGNKSKCLYGAREVEQKCDLD